MKDFFYYLSLIITVIILSGCGKPIPQESLIHIDVNYNNRLVLSTDDASDLSNYYHYLFEDPSPSQSINGDLIYQLDLRTYETLITYQLLFDTKQQKAQAVSSDGAMAFPYEFLHTYLEALPIPEAFPEYDPPALSLYVDGYAMTYGYDQQWLLHPSTEVSYPVKDADSHSENYKSLTTNMAISGAYNYKVPDTLSLDIIGIEGTVHHNQVALEDLPTPDSEGAYRYELTANWTDASKGYSGSITYHFGVSIALPESYALNKLSFEPGDCITLLITNPKGLDYRITTEAYSKTIGLFYLDDNLTGLIPLDPRSTPGNYTVNIYLEGNDHPLEIIDYEIVHKDFDIQYLKVSNSTASLKSDDNYAKDAEKFKNAKTHSAGEKLWEGTFLQPIQGRISTEYAMMRYVNGSPTSYRHSGIDIAAPKGTGVMAANHGTVTFASDLIVSGNVIVLDHGYGLFSSYVHLDELYVEEGQTVTKGDIIGAVGSTGYSTGPHLHWSLWKNGVYLNPWKFIEEDPLEVFEN